MPDTVIVTTVHELQVLDEELPATSHDFQVDVIVTPGEAITCSPTRERSGVQWSDLPADYMNTIPVLALLDGPRSER